jgi:coenzyme F420-0:L-glutamate ligase/coenzyme F420-1:gamma-L-glutamate ligase
MTEKDLPTLTLTSLAGMPLIEKGDDLGALILKALEDSHIQLEDGDVVVVAQKVVSKTEGRKVDLSTVTPSPAAEKLAEETEKDPRVVELILRESKEIVRTRPGLIIAEHRNGFICANAGIDHSNVRAESQTSEDWVLMLPEDPDRSAREIRALLEKETGAQIGVLIIDSHGRAWRLGTVGISIGLSGMPALQDLRGWPDLFDYKLRITRVGAADELAAAASLMMGQAAEGRPVVHVRGFPYPLQEASHSEILRPKEEDLFR